MYAVLYQQLADDKNQYQPVDPKNEFYHNTNGMLDQRGGGYKSSLVTYFVQTCSLISIHNGMYTVCSNDTLH